MFPIFPIFTAAHQLNLLSDKFLVLRTVDSRIQLTKSHQKYLSRPPSDIDRRPKVTPAFTTARIGGIINIYQNSKRHCSVALLLISLLVIPTVMHLQLSVFNAFSVKVVMERERHTFTRKLIVSSASREWGVGGHTFTHSLHPRAPSRPILFLQMPFVHLGALMGGLAPVT
uniref:Uncharacterized protein n=1 Tax=Scophthalmus maximus TaxID=52904 RepID=A0A8D3CQQ9_SCOMX